MGEKKKEYSQGYETYNETAHVIIISFFFAEKKFTF